jgi:hypothetical protein
MPQCGIEETAHFHFELQYSLFSGSIFSLEAISPADSESGLAKIF